MEVRIPSGLPESCATSCPAIALPAGAAHPLGHFLSLRRQHRHFPATKASGCGHTAGKAPEPVRFQQLSPARLCQYWGGRPPGNAECRILFLPPPPSNLQNCRGTRCVHPLALPRSAAFHPHSTYNPDRPQHTAQPPRNTPAPICRPGEPPKPPLWPVLCMHGSVNQRHVV